MISPVSFLVESGPRMAQFTNSRSCPAFIVSHVRSRLEREETAYRKEPSWIETLLGRARKREYVGLYEVRWLSGFVQENLACTGYLLGRWIVGPASIKPMNLDFAGDGPKESFGKFAIYNFWHPVLLDFAIDDEESACVVSRIGYDGDVSSFKHVLTNGIESKELGDVVGSVIRRKIERRPGDQCAPLGWIEK